MKKGENVTKAKLELIIDALKNVFDLVRVVDPYSVSVLDDDLKNTNDPSQVCFKVWEKNARCSNCISLKAYTDFQRKSKYEFQRDTAFSVIAMPFSIIDDNNKTVVVEMVDQVSNEIQVKTVGQEIISRTINEIDRKLYTDSLTGIKNRRYFDENLFIYETKSTLSRNVAFLIFDIRHFKHINDSFGHITGDTVLKKVAEELEKSILSGQVCARIGGDEFIIIMQNCTEEEAAATINTIKENVRKIRLSEMGSYHIEINAGYSFTNEFNASKDMIRELERIADKNMYNDKNL